MPPSFPFFEIELQPEAKTATLWLNRPTVRNAMNWDFWSGLPDAIAWLEQQAQVHAVVVRGRGPAFSIGLDLKEFYMQQRETLHAPLADEREQLLALIRQMQRGMQAIAHSSKVYIAAVHGHCIGAGLDLIAACDIRLSSADASYSLREAKVGIVADMGSLNRLPAIIGQGNTRLLAFTGRDIDAATAQRMGLVSDISPDETSLHTTAQALAAEIAANPGLALRGTKHILNHQLAHGPDEGMDYVALYNAAFLDSADFREVILAFLEKRKPNFR